jgi:16S rRNA processing protein RimM
MSRDVEMVLIGKVVATQGVKGQLRVVAYSGDPASILALPSVVLKGPGGEDCFEVAAAVVHGKKLLLSLKPFDNINQVLHLVGRELLAERSQLPELPKGEYYWRDLLGMKVVTDQGEALGEVVEVIATGSNDVFVVKAGAKELLLPAIADVVRDMDMVQRVITVTLLEGLRDL